MEIRFLAGESYGVRSLAAFVRTRRHRYLFDPGVSLAPRRSKLPPHPLEVAASYLARERIVQAAAEADTIVLTHYHHDHFTPFMFREHEWSDEETARTLYRGRRLLGKSPSHDLNYNQRRRAATLRQRGFAVQEADGRDFGDIRFSPPVPHGEAGSPRGCVVMALVEESGDRFAFASDIQLLDDRAVELLLAWQPRTCLLSGPPIYLEVVTPALRRAAAKRAGALARQVDRLIIDHHLLRTLDYRPWLDSVAAEGDVHGHQVSTARECEGRPPLLLEGMRKELFRRWPVGRSYLPELARGDPRIRAWIADLARLLAKAGGVEEVPPQAAQ
jgi:hypothetical protein